MIHPVSYTHLDVYKRQSLNSVAKLPYHWALDGISNTQTSNPEALGHSEEERKENLVPLCIRDRPCRPSSCF